MSRVFTLAQAGEQLSLTETQIVRRSSVAGLNYIRDARFVRPTDLPALADPPPPWPPRIANEEKALDAFEQALMAGMRRAGVSRLG